jgi:murein DD-endopeptidase MepM/ murein hydrolase activator NlpD
MGGVPAKNNTQGTRKFADKAVYIHDGGLAMLPYAYLKRLFSWQSLFIAGLALSLLSSCKPPVSAPSSDGNFAAIAKGEGENTLVVSRNSTFFKKEKDAAWNLGEDMKCLVSPGETLQFVGELAFADNHLELTLAENSLPSCPFRKGYIFGPQYADLAPRAEPEPSASGEGGVLGAAASGSYLYPMGSSVPTCHEAGGGAGGFGTGRSGGSRKHAGCDMYAAVGTPIYAVEDGVVLDLYSFYCSTDALEVKGSRVIRYGEIRPGSAIKYNARPGQTVKRGQVIAEVGRLDCYYQPMLHFELYGGTASGPLTTSGNAFQRRSDLLDPTAGLFKWRKERFSR